MHCDPLNVFAFASANMCSEVRRAIEQCGYATDCFPGHYWFEASTSDSLSTPVVLYESDWKGAPAPEEFLLNSPRGAWVGIFGGDCGPLTAHCSDFVLWPAGRQELQLRLDRISGKCDVSNRVAGDELARKFAAFNVVGESPLFRGLLGRVEKIAKVVATTLIEGETGTGKELIARAIHYTGPRRRRAYIAVNCGAIPEGLVESEFFGHERGAFTDAREKRIGVVEQACGGTLFLDEVEALCPKGQVTLLRLLQEQEFRPVGSSTPRRADVRVIAASNTPLQELTERGKFRSDLYFRLNILTVCIPPLRERPQDIEPLCCRFLQSLRSRYGGPAKALSPAALKQLRQHPWPGNVRELENLLHRAYVFSEGPELEFPEERSGEAAPEAPFRGDFQTEKSRVLRQFEREYLTWALATCDGNVTRAAQLAGKERRAMGKLLKKYLIDRKAL